MSIDIQQRFTIEKCSLISQWAWKTHNDFCPICRNSINEESITMENDPDATSHIVIGKCGHAFHYECIEKWLKTSSNVCPLCNTNWDYTKKNDINTMLQIEPEPTVLLTPPEFIMPGGLSVSTSNENNNEINNEIISNQDSWGPPPEPDNIDSDDDMPPLEEITHGNINENPWQVNNLTGITEVD